MHNDIKGCTYTLSLLIYSVAEKLQINQVIFIMKLLTHKESKTRRAKHHCTLLRHFKVYWRKDCLLSLRQFHSIKRKASFRQSIEVGDVVVLKNDCTRCAFWKLQCSSCEVISEGTDRVMRAAVIKVARQDSQPMILNVVRNITTLLKSNQTVRIRNLC